MPPGGGYDAGRVSVTLGFDLDDRQLRVYDQQINRARSQRGVKTELKFDLDDRAYHQFLRDANVARGIPNVHFKIEVDVDRAALAGATAGMRDAGTAARTAQGPLRSLAAAFGGAGKGAQGARLSLGGLSSSMTQIAQLAVALAPALLAVGGALTALASSAAAAVGGLAAVATGLGATFMPVALLAVGVVTRLAKVTGVYKQQQAEAQSAAMGHTAATKGLADQQDALASAFEGVRAARENVTQAEEAYGAAVAAARQEIRDGREAEVRAARDVADAQENLATARRDAARAAEDARRQAEDANISLADAQRRRDELQAQGLTGTREYFDAQRTVAEATTEAGRAEEERAAFAERGLRAFGPLVSALRAVTDAEKNLRDRRRELNKLESDGIRHNTGVVNSLRAVRDARRGVTQALRAQAAAQRSAAAGAAGTAAGAKTNFLMGELDQAERGMLGSIHRIVDAFRKATRPAVDGILRGISSGLDRLGPALMELRPEFTRLGNALGGITDRFFKDITGPRWMAAWHQFAQAAVPISRDLGGVFRDFLSILRDVAQAALPAIKDLMGDLRDTTHGWAEDVHRALNPREGGGSHLQDIMTDLIDSFRDWMGLLGALTEFLVTLFSGGRESGDGMVQSLTKHLQGWTDWMKKHPERVKKFFQDARDVVADLGKVLGPMVSAFVRFAQWGIKLAAAVPDSYWKAVGAFLAAVAVARFTGAITMLRWLVKAWEMAKSPITRMPPGPPTPPGADTPPGGPGGGAGRPGRGGRTTADPRDRVGRIKYGDEFRPGRPVSELGEVPSRTPVGRGARGAGALSIASILASFLVPRDSKAGSFLFGRRGSAEDSLQKAISGIRHEMPGAGIRGNSPAALNAAIDRLARQGDSGKLRKLQGLMKGFGDTMRDVMKTDQIDAYVASISQLAETVDARFGGSIGGALGKSIKDHEKWQRRVAEVQGDVGVRWTKLARKTGANVEDMEATVRRNSREIRRHIGRNTEEGAAALDSNFKHAVQWVRTHMRDAKGLTKEGMEEIERLLRARLKEFGVDPNETILKGRPVDSTGSKRGGAGWRQASGGWGGRPANLFGGRADGGWIGHPGERGADLVHAILGRGEAVLNHHQQDYVNEALQIAGMRGGLNELFDKTSQTRHFLATGGFAGIPKYAAGGGAHGRDALEEWNRIFPRHGLRDAAGHARMTPSLVRRLAERFGLPGRAFEQIAHGESMYYPGIIGDDAAAGYGNTFGYGLWQITTGVGNDALVNRHGGWPAMLNPFRNAAVAAAMYRASGLKPWYGTKYLTPAARAAASRGAGTAATQPKIPGLSVPGIRRGTAMDAIVSGALRAGVRGANRVIDRANADRAGVGGGGPMGAPGGGGLGRFDGLPVANWIIPILNWARRHGWRGHLTSGYRSHATNVAHGRFYHSNHEDTAYPGGAIDVGGYGARAEGAALAGVLRRYRGQRRLVWGGPTINDWGHFSATGHARGGIARGRRIPFVGRFAGGGYTWGRNSWSMPRRSSGSQFSWGQNSQTSGGLGLEAARNASGADLSLLSPVDSPPRRYRSLMQTVERLNTRYGLQERIYGSIRAEVVNPDTGELDRDAIDQRVRQLTVMKEIRDRIVDTIREMVEEARRIIAAYQEAIRRLRNVVPFARPTVRTALRGEIASYSEALTGWKNQVWTLENETLPNAQMDSGDVQAMIDEIQGTKADPNRGGGSGDLEAALAQANERTRIAERTVAIQEAYIRAAGSSGDIGAGYSTAFAAAMQSPGTETTSAGGSWTTRSGVVSPAGSAPGSGGGGGVSGGGGNTIIVQTLHPGDPDTLRAIGDAATAGQTYQGFTEPPRQPAGI